MPGEAQRGMLPRRGRAHKGLGAGSRGLGAGGTWHRPRPVYSGRRSAHEASAAARHHAGDRPHPPLPRGAQVLSLAALTTSSRPRERGRTERHRTQSCRLARHHPAVMPRRFPVLQRRRPPHSRAHHRFSEAKPRNFLRRCHIPAGHRCVQPCVSRPPNSDEARSLAPLGMTANALGMTIQGRRTPFWSVRME
jgi:hypothetical protein